MLFSITPMDGGNSLGLDLKSIHSMKRGDVPFSFDFTFEGSLDSTYTMTFYRKTLEPGFIHFKSGLKGESQKNMVQLMFYSSGYWSSGDKNKNSTLLNTFNFQGHYELASFDFYFHPHLINDRNFEKLIKAIYDNSENPKHLLRYTTLKLLTKI